MPKFDWTPHKGGNHEFVKFDQVGDGVTGTIINIRTRTFDEKKGEVVLLDINAGGEEPVSLTVDRVDLRQKVADAEPQIGDRIRVRFVGDQKIPGSPNPMKIFTVEVRRGTTGLTPVPSGMVPVGPAPAPEPVTTVDDYGEFSDEPF